jgi:hypothetical protein
MVFQDTWKYRWYRLLMGKRHPGIGLATGLWVLYGFE